MIATATTTQTVTMMPPRRRSAAFCYARISSTTLWRSLRAVFDDLDDLAIGLSSVLPDGLECGESTERQAAAEFATVPDRTPPSRARRPPPPTPRASGDPLRRPRPRRRSS